MKKEKRVRGMVAACAFVLLMLGVLFAGIVPVAAATTWYVDDSGGADFMSVQDAVNATSEGDTIIVKDGTYVENVKADKNHLTIKSENGADSTIVQTVDPYENVFVITADYVNVSGFTATGATATGRTGFYLHYGNYCNISYNTASNNFYSIALLYSDSNTIFGNTANENNYYGIQLGYSNDNTVFDNNITSNNYCGIRLYDSDSNIVLGNTANENYFGIIIYHSNDNTLSSNTVNHNDYGIHLHISSDNNIIYLNNFISNKNNVYPYHSTNIWNYPEQITYTYLGDTYTNYLGNYYSDYTDIDANNDGIWDNPYSIDLDNDYYPLVDPFENYDVSLQGRIAFASSRDWNQEVYVMNADGSSHPIDLTNFPDADDGDPTWSPDGKQIAFSSNRSGNWKTYVMDADDGGNQVCLLEGVYDAWGPAWSPDGKEIAFACQLSSDEDFEIYTMDIQSKALTKVTDNGVTDCHPAWSPNSHKIVFTSTRDGNHELYVADLLAGTKTRLTDDPAYDDYPEWSPDGSRIVFVSDRDGNLEIYSMDFASKAITRVTYNEHTDKHAQWSPDGQKIIFVSNRDGGGDLDVYFMNADGTSIACLVDWEGDETHPTWSPSSAPDQPPIASFTYSSENPMSGQMITFDASDSYDFDGEIIFYEWDFGDGTTAEGKIVNHRFRGKMDYPKSYTVTLTVKDDDGNKGTDNAVIKVEPLKAVAEVIIPQILPIVPSPFARVTVWYNWVDNVEGKDIYMVSYMNVRAEGIIGYYNILLWDEGHIHPIWSDLRGLLGDTINYYPPPFKNIFGGTAPYKVVHYEGEIYEGTEVTDLAAIQIIAYGMAGGDFSPDGPGLPPLFFEVDSAVFQPDYVGAPDLPIESSDLTFIHLCSPGELRVYDSQGRVTGLVNGEIKEEIPNSMYNDELVMMPSSSDSFTYEVKGTNEGSYGLGVATITDREFFDFTATTIPTLANAMHQYKISWNALSQGEEGVTVQVDSDGDGTFEYTFTADNELTQEEFLSGTDGEPIPEFTTIAIPVAAIIGLLFLFSQRGKKEEV